MIRTPDRNKSRHRPGYQAEWREKHKEEIRAYHAEYRANNADKLRQHQKAYRERHKDSPEYKLQKNLRERLRAAMKGLARSGKTITLVGCTIEQLKAYLEKQFKDGMSWNNYGDWHIDHIKPVTKFNLLQPEDQLQCFHYSNLQPLWAIDNIKKSNKYE